MPDKMTLTPGGIVDNDVEALLNLQLMAKGVDLSDTEGLRKRLVPKFDPASGSFKWELDGSVILTFERSMVSEAVLGYTLVIARLIVPARIIH